MKKIISVLVLAGVMTLTACDNSNNEQVTESTSVTTVTETTTAMETTVETEVTTTTEATTTAEDTTTVSETTTLTDTLTEIDVCACATDWQHAYSEYLNELEYYTGVCVEDINSDGIEELIIAVNPFENTIILTCVNNTIQEFYVETMSTWGYVRYIPETKQILHCPFYGHTDGTFGNITYYLYDWNGTEYVTTFSMKRDSGSNNEYGQGYINDVEVDTATFNDKLLEIEQLVNDNTYFEIVETTANTYAKYINEKLPCVKITE